MNDNSIQTSLNPTKTPQQILQRLLNCMCQVAQQTGQPLIVQIDLGQTRLNYQVNQYAHLTGNQNVLTLNYTDSPLVDTITYDELKEQIRQLKRENGDLRSQVSYLQGSLKAYYQDQIIRLTAYPDQQGADSR